MASTLDTDRIIHAPIRQSTQSIHENHQPQRQQDNQYGGDQFDDNNDENAHHRMMMSIEGEDNRDQ